jgi:50S ribosomal subunit-associated GTPase HflX
MSLADEPYAEDLDHAGDDLNATADELHDLAAELERLDNEDEEPAVMSAADAIDPDALARRLGHSVEAVRHSLRFRQVSTAYPHHVALAYDRDLAAAAADSDEEVAARVAAWEREQGLEPRDWRVIGSKGRGEEAGS